MRTLSEIMAEMKKDAKDILGIFKAEIKDVPDLIKKRFPKIPHIRKVYISDEMLLDREIKTNLRDIDMVFAYEPNTGVFYTLIKTDEGPQSFYSWRDMRIATFFIFSGERFKTIDEAVRFMVGNENFKCDIYQVVLE